MMLADRNTWGLSNPLPHKKGRAEMDQGNEPVVRFEGFEGGFQICRGPHANGMRKNPCEDTPGGCLRCSRNCAFSLVICGQIIWGDDGMRVIQEPHPDWVDPIATNGAFPQDRTVIVFVDGTYIAASGSQVPQSFRDWATAHPQDLRYVLTLAV